MTTIVMALVALAVLGFIIYRQLVTRPVTIRDLLLPLLGGLYLTAMYANQPGSAADLVTLVAGTVFGVATGLGSATMVAVWRDATTGTVLQRGGWKYLLVLVSLIVARILLRVAAQALHLDVSTIALNEALIGMAVGNYGGRAVLVGMRALALQDRTPTTTPGSRFA